MPSRFFQLTRDEFDKLLRRFEFQRKILSVHLHHTWRPSRSQFAGVSSLESMQRYHTRENRLGDLAPHLLIAPDGTLWTGRAWDSPPASAKGNNGTPAAGPFMISIIGDFDRGRDALDGEQRATLVAAVARLQLKCSLAADSLLLHGELSGGENSCPGNSINRQALLEEIRTERNKLAQQEGAATSAWAAQGSEFRDPRLDQMVAELARVSQGAGNGENDEPDEARMTPQQERIMLGLEGATLRAPGARGADDELTPEMLGELRPHVINLNQGEFSEEGVFRTSQSDVDAIFDDHLERALFLAEAEGRPLRLLFWAHGGLISEPAGLKIAHLQVAWWKREKNGVYPIHFVWETGFSDALKQILSGAREAAAARGITRDLWDYSTDPGVEALARTLGGVKLWGAMKQSARLASEEKGGATYTAQKLAQFCARHPDQVELHAAGHSAGSIFQAHFLPVAFQKGVPPFESLSFLAPALRVDEFKARLQPLLGGDIKRLVMFTMKRDWEENDSVASVYRKSLLYLIYYALEPGRREPILGLEISTRGDAELAALFGLQGTPSRVGAEVVWSKTITQTGRGASTSATHGGFDNDRPTMNSVLRRMVNRDDIDDFPEEALGRALGDAWDGPPQLPREFTRMLQFQKPCGHSPVPGTGASTPAPVAQQGQVGAAGGAQVGGAQAVSGAPAGARKALCIGIDKYPAAPLYGCVSDARNWAGCFQDHGYQVTSLHDEQATRKEILGNLERMVVGSKPGDTLLFQYSGHGTELDDIDGDEELGQGTNGPKDEALCPFDYAQGNFAIDDDIADIFCKIPDQVRVTCFIDCCHSGTITRFMVGGSAGDLTQQRPRFIVATAEMQQSHRLFRQTTARRGLSPERRPENMRQVVFSACLDSEVAYESNGQGEFTLRALQVLRQGAAGMSNEGVLNSILNAFGPSARQHPELDCAPVARKAPFLV